jgi:hypothetical protein
MSKMCDMLAVSIAINPSDAHVKASRLKLLHKPEQRLALLARHGSLTRTALPERPAFAVQRAPLAATNSTEQSALCLRYCIEKAKGRL